MEKQSEWDYAMETARRLDAEYDSTPGGVPPVATARTILLAKAEALREAAELAWWGRQPHIPFPSEAIRERADVYERAAKEGK